MKIRISALALTAIMLLAQDGRAQSVSFSDTVANAPIATEPFAGTDAVPIIQNSGGRNLTHKWLPQTGTISMLPNASNALTSTYFPFGSGLYPQYETATTTTANTVMGSPDITVASVANISIGNVISTTSPSFVPAPGNMTYVKNISGTTVTLSDNATASLTGASVTFGVDRFDAGNTVFTNVLASRNGYFGAAAQGRSTWVAKYWSAGDFPIDHALFAVAENGGIQAAVEASHTAGAPFGYNLTNGILMVDDDGSVQHFSQANYVQSNLVAYAPGSSHIQSEMSISNTAYPPGSVTPYTVNAPGMVENLRLDCGTGGPGGNNCSTALHLVNNGAKYGVGVVFDSISVAVDGSGLSSAIQLPRTYAIDWISPTPGVGWRMYSQATVNNHSVIMDDSDFKVDAAIIATVPVVNSTPASFELRAGSVTGAVFSSDGQNYAAVQSGNFPLILGANFGNQMTFTSGGGVQIGAPTGGDKGADTLNVKGAYYADGTLGVSCSGSPTSSFASVNGIVTHC